MPQGYVVGRATLAKEHIDNLVWLFERPEAASWGIYLLSLGDALDRQNRKPDIDRDTAQVVRGELKNIETLLGLPRELLSAQTKAAATAGEVATETDHEE